MVIPRDPHVDLLDTDQSTPCRTSDATRNARHADLPQKEYKVEKIEIGNVIQVYIENHFTQP